MYQKPIVFNNTIHTFAGSIITSDMFHARKAHETCSGAFKISHWTKLTGVKVNSSRSEQYNSKLRNLESSVRNAKLSNCCSITFCFMALYNLRQAKIITHDHIPRKR